MILTKDDLLAISHIFDARFDSIDEKFKSIDEKFESIDKRFESIDNKFDSIDKKFDSIDKKFDSIDKRFESIDKKFDSIDDRLKIMELKQDRTAKKLDNLQFEVKASERNIRKDIHKLQDEMETVIEVLRQNEMLPH